MAHDPVNQKQFAEDVAAAAAAGKGESFVNVDDPIGNLKLPNIDEIWKLIEQMDDISEDDRAQLRENLYSSQEGNAKDFIKRFAQPDMVHSSWDYTIFFVMMAVIMLVFALFGYKLYKSLKEKELKRQEKLKQKHSKKSKKMN